MRFVLLSDTHNLHHRMPPHQAVTIEGIKLWGSPWQPWFYDWAFNLQRGPEIARKWEMIPDDIHVLATHGPPQGVLDETSRRPAQSVGCEALQERIAALPLLKLHVFGHIHEGYGTLVRDGRTFVNASICDVHYAPVNPAITVDLG